MQNITDYNRYEQFKNTLAKNLDSHNAVEKCDESDE